MNTEKLVKNLLEKISKDKKSLNVLKNTLIQLQQYEFAAEVRDIELKTFPKTEEMEVAEKLGQELNVAFRMVGLPDISTDVCWLLSETVKTYNKKKGKFDVGEATKLLNTKEKLFQ